MATFSYWLQKTRLASLSQNISGSGKNSPESEGWVEGEGRQLSRGCCEPPSASGPYWTTEYKPLTCEGGIQKKISDTSEMVGWDGLESVHTYEGGGVPGRWVQVRSWVQGLQPWSISAETRSVFPRPPPKDQQEKWFAHNELWEFYVNAELTLTCKTGLFFPCVVCFRVTLASLVPPWVPQPPTSPITRTCQSWQQTSNETPRRGPGQDITPTLFQVQEDIVTLFFPTFSDNNIAKSLWVIKAAQRNLNPFPKRFLKLLEQ